MAIRLRRVNGRLVALCAAKSIPKEGDLYLDDEAHHALYVKFDLDIADERLTYAIHGDSIEASVMAQEESNNPARDWWDQTYGTQAEEDARMASLRRTHG